MTAYNLYFFLLPFETTFNEIAAGTEVKTVNNNARTSGFRNMQYSLLIATGETRKIRGQHCGGLACQCYYFSFFFYVISWQAACILFVSLCGKKGITNM